MRNLPLVTQQRNERLRAARRAAGWTQAELADRANLPRDLVTSIEIGRIRDPRWRTVSRLARALACEPRDLFHTDDGTAA